MSVLQNFYNSSYYSGGPTMAGNWALYSPTGQGSLDAIRANEAGQSENLSTNVFPQLALPDDVLGRLGFTGQRFVPAALDPQSTNDGQNQFAETPEYRAFLENLTAQGYKVGVGGSNGGFDYVLLDPQGREVTSWNSGNDDAFGLAALAAGGLIGWQAAGLGNAGSTAATTAAPAAPPAAGGSGTIAGASPNAFGTSSTVAGGTGMTAPSGTWGTVGTAGSSTAGAGTWSSFFQNPQTWRGIFDVASGLYGMRLADKARDASDPFAPYRAGYAQQLQQLETNPSMITQRPGWSAGISAINSSAGATGLFGSGNEKAALARWGGDFYNAELARLAGLAGAGQTPGAGQFQAAMLDSSALASLAYGFGRFIPTNQRGG